MKDSSVAKRTAFIDHVTGLDLFSQLPKGPPIDQQQLLNKSSLIFLEV